VVYLEPAHSAGDGADCDRCPRCQTEYPRVEGIRCVPADLDAFLEAQGEALEPAWLPASDDPRGLPAWARAAASDPASDAFREAMLPGQYAMGHFPEGLPDGALARELSCNARLVETVGAWLDEARPPEDTPADCALEVGCGPGRLLHELAGRLPRGALGLDVRLSMLRVASRLAEPGHVVLPFRVEGARFAPVRFAAPQPPAGPVHWLQGDGVQPPLVAETFPLVVAMSLLDTVGDPLAVLGQLDALLAPGGLLLLGTPYHWEPAVTPPQAWWPDGARMVRAALEQMAYDVLAESDGLPWVLPGHGRLTFRFLLDVLLARKRSPRRE